MRAVITALLGLQLCLAWGEAHAKSPYGDFSKEELAFIAEDAQRQRAAYEQLVADGALCDKVQQAWNITYLECMAKLGHSR